MNVSKIREGVHPFEIPKQGFINKMIIFICIFLFQIRAYMFETPYKTT